MGLDVYLYRYDGKTPAEAEALEEALERRIDATLPYLDHDKSTESDRNARYEERDVLRKQIAAEYECGEGEYGGWNGKQCIKENDAVYPDHYFKLGYFRSSYNDSGIDRQARNYFGVDGLYWIFDRTREDEYVFQPDWAKARERALEMAQKFRAREPKVSVHFEGWNIFTSPEEMPSDANDALQRWLKGAGADYKTPRTGDEDGYRWFSNRDGFFPLRPAMRLVGAIPGIGPLKSPGLFLIYEQTDDPDGGDEWYARACEIVARTCDYVLNSDEVEKFYLSWSS